MAEQSKSGGDAGSPNKVPIKQDNSEKTKIDKAAVEVASKLSHDALERDDSMPARTKKSVVGFDLSQDRFRVATIGADKVSYLVHDVPAAMCFVGKERFIGENTAGREGLFYDIMKLVGKSFDDLSSDLNLRRHVKKSDGNLLCLCLPSLDMECHYTPTHLLAMFFSKMKCLAEEHLGPQVAILGFCIGVPAYFTKLQCLAIRQAAEIAGLHGVSFMSATTATALASCVTAQHRWPEGEHVAVVSISSKNTEVTIAHLDEKNKLVVSSYTCDLHLGEDDFINVLRGHYQEKECKEIIKISKRMGSKTTLKFSGREKTREEIAEICKPLLDRMNGLVEQAVEKAMLGEKGIKAIELAGSGCDMFFVSSALRDHFHLTPTNAWKIAREGVAMGCAMNCAILQHKEFNLRLGDFSDKEANDKLSLLNRNVADKFNPSDENESSTVSNDEGMCGRVKLTPEEISAAHDKERKMLLPIRVKEKIDGLFKLEDFMQNKEKEFVGRCNCHQLLNGGDRTAYLDAIFNDGDEKVEAQYAEMLNELCKIAARILARKSEYENKDIKIKELKRKINEYLELVSSTSDIYCKVKQSAKEKFKLICTGIKEWLTKKEAELAKRPKHEDPIGFVWEADDKLIELTYEWAATLDAREPDIVTLSFNVVTEMYLGMIDKYRRELQTDVEIMNCHMLPQQIHYKGIPNVWIHAHLYGRGSDHTMIHVRKYNGYMMGFSNMEGTIFELGEARVDGEQKIYYFRIFPGTDMPCNCDYISMINRNRDMGTSQVYAIVAALKLDTEFFLNCIHVCSFYKIKGHECDKCSAEEAIFRAAMGISFMMNEPGRMRVVCNRVHNGTDFVRQGFSEILMDFIWNWAAISKAVREWNQKVDKNVNDPITVRLKDENVKYMWQLFEILYLILDEVPPQVRDDMKLYSTLPPRPPPSGGPPGNGGDSNQKQAPPPPPAAPGNGGDPGQSGDGGDPGQSGDGGDHGKSSQTRYAGSVASYHIFRKVNDGEFQELIDRTLISGQAGRDGDAEFLAMQDYYRREQEKLVNAACGIQYLLSLKFDCMHRLAEFLGCDIPGIDSIDQVAAFQFENLRPTGMVNQDGKDLSTAYLEITEELRMAEQSFEEHYLKQVQNQKMIMTYLEKYLVPAATGEGLEEHLVPAATGEGLEEHLVPAATGEGRNMKGAGGQILAEIFSVFVDPCLANEIGCIKVHEDYRSHVIYQYDDTVQVEQGTPYAGRGVSGLPCVKNKIALPLSGPWVAISSAEGCSLEFFPKELNSHGAGDGVSRKEGTTLMCLDEGNLVCNEQVFKTMTVGRGIAHVSYAIWSGAVEGYVRMNVHVPFGKRQGLGRDPIISGYIGAYHPGSTEGVSRIFESMPASLPVRKQQAFLSRVKHEYISMERRFEEDLHSRGLVQLGCTIDVPLLQSVVAVRLGSTVTFKGVIQANDDKEMNILCELGIPSEVEIIDNVYTPWIECGGGCSYQVSMHLRKMAGRFN